MTGEIAAHRGYRSLAEREFDAVVCDPGHFGREGERRWSTAEGAQAWSQHCLGHAALGSLVAVAMPSKAASASDARTLRGVLLRSGVLRAIIAGIPDSPDLWLLRQSDDQAAHVLLVDADGEPSRALQAWRTFEQDPTHADAAPYVARVVDLLDDEIDLTPRTCLADPLDQYPALRAALLDEPAGEPPHLGPESGSHGTISLEELAEAGAVTVHEAPPTVGSEDGDTPMLSAKDVRLGRAPSRWGSTETHGAVTVRKGDVAVVISTEAAVRVCVDDGVLLGSGIRLVRTTAVDPHFLAGVLRAAIEAADGGPIDLYQVSVPRISPAEQRRYGIAFDQLSEFEAEWHRRRARVERLVRVGFRGLAQGRLRPAVVAE